MNNEEANGGFNELALFAGAGGGILGGHLLGWRTVCAVEWDAYAASVLVARQNDGCLPPFPIWDDVQTFDGRPWRGRVDIVSGGFPCQDISAAGKGAGINGERSGMWSHMARIVGEVEPSFVFVENSPLLVGRGLGVVLADLAAMGYDAKWGVVSAENAGALHQRERLWIVANSNLHGMPERIPATRQGSSEMGFRDRGIFWGSKDAEWTEEGGLKPLVRRDSDGVPQGVDRLTRLGNAQVPAVAALAWRLLGGPMNAGTARTDEPRARFEEDGL